MSQTIHHEAPVALVCSFEVITLLWQALELCGLIGGKQIWCLL